MKAIFILLLFACLQTSAQNVIPFTSGRWKISGKEAVQEEFQGKQCLKLTNGKAILGDANFKNGIIEFDMAVTQQRYFPGMGFRMQDENNGEEFYVRPHQSGNPDAMQYYPEYNGDGAWQLYYGEGFGNPHKIPFDRWIHIKMLVKDTMAEVYFDDEAAPVLFIRRLYRPVAAGMIALNNEWPVAARFADVKYTVSDDITFTSKPKPAPPLPANVITTWQVSSPFDEKLLQGKSLLSAAHIDSLSWQSVTADERGITDLGMLAPVLPAKNTMFAKLVINSDKAEIKKFSFGFSDRARVYCNGKLLYFGSDIFLSRDYRFLGTIGLYDAVYLDLKKGKNEVVVAVSEDFGGWGVMAALDSL